MFSSYSLLFISPAIQSIITPDLLKCEPLTIDQGHPRGKCHSGSHFLGVTGMEPPRRMDVGGRLSHQEIIGKIWLPGQKISIRHHCFYKKRTSSFDMKFPNHLSSKVVCFGESYLNNFLITRF